MKSGFEIIEHTADAGIAAYGHDLKEAFANAAQGMFSLVADLEGIEERVQRRVAVAAADIEALLVEWLNELIFLLDAEGLLFRRFDITFLGETALEAVVFGERADPARHHLKTAIKAATYHQLKVEKMGGDRGYRVQVILDL